MSEVDPGQGAYGAPGVAQQYARMSTHEIVYQALLANPPPVPVGFAIPLTPEEFEQATQMYLDRLGPDLMRMWDQIYEQSMGHISDKDFAALFARHEPLYIPQWQAVQITMAEQAAAGMIDPVQAQMQAEQAQFDPSLQGPVPNPWLAGLMRTCGYQCRKDLLRYARIKEAA